MVSGRANAETSLACTEQVDVQMDGSFLRKLPGLGGEMLAGGAVPTERHRLDGEEQDRPRVLRWPMPDFAPCVAAPSVLCQARAPP